MEHQRVYARRRSAIARRQVGQRQSLDASLGGIGSTNGSAAHQQSPPSPQSKAAPQRPHVS
jgi:hypothetical protein